mmetsp:Transcript_49960/g.44771  ORF Transcript_49960/g.44771 Transcript_49960/m.44771 type:complete len:384 (-) Transcript_49960:239-1390(-)
MYKLFISSAVLISSVYSRCCDLHMSAATCQAEAGQSCTILTDQAQITLNGGGICVSDDNAICLAKMAQTGKPRAIACPPAPASDPASPVNDPNAPAFGGPVCSFAQCTNNNVEYNIQFILDESGSVGATNYDSSVDFVKALIENDVNDVSPVSVYSFSNAVDTLYQFGQDQNSRTSVLSALDGAKSTAGAYQGRCTDTLSALTEAVDHFATAADNGNLNSGDRFLFLITDGVPYCGCGLPSTCKTDVCGASGAAVRQKIDDYDIRIFTMGIGSFDITTIECLSTTQDVFQVSGFTSDDFTNLEEQVRPTLCPAVMPPFMDRIFAVLSTPVSSFNESSLLIKSVILLLTSVFIYGMYRLYANKKYAGYEKLNTSEAQYGSTQTV